MSETKKELYGWRASMGMSLYQKIKQDLKTSMVNKDNSVRDTMRLIMGDFPKLTVPITLEGGKKSTRPKKPEEITDDDILDIIRSFVKSEKINLEIRKQETSDYFELLNWYLPAMADRDTIVAWINENVDFSRFKSPAQAMGLVMKHFGKLAQGDLVKEILQSVGTDGKLPH
ncbi:MAG: GatB/YqeY domain-containing protein [Pseudomonadota bacterium]